MIEKVYKPKQPYQRSERKCEKINTRINRFKHFTEFIYYNYPFDVFSGTFDYYWVDTSTGEKLSNQQKAFIEKQDESEIIAPVELLDDTARSQYESCRRAKDNFYGYALCNDWTYFSTFTISKNEYESTDTATKHYWKLFKMRLQYYCKDVKILAVPERHENGNIHFHALLGNCDLSNLLTVAVSPKTNKPIISKGRQVYNLPLWNKGFSTIVKIDTADNENQLKAINYIIGYVTKQENNIGLNQKRYYRTTNLDFKNSQLSFTSKEKYENLLLDTFSNKGLIKHKETNKMIVFRVYN